MALQLAQTALVDLATALGELNLSADPEGNPVTRLINAASQRIESYVNRSLTFAQRADTYGIPGDNVSRLQLNVFPICPPVAASIIQVELGLDPGVLQNTLNVLVPGRDFFFEDAERGWLFRRGGWGSTAVRRPDIVQDYDLSQVERTLEVTYLAGYVTPVQVENALEAWPTGGTPAPATLLSPTGQPTQVWACTISGTVGLSEPSWPVSPTQFATIVDGAATWTFLGYDGTTSAQPQAATLPDDIEQAAIDTVVTWYRRRGQSIETTDEKFGDSSVSFGKARMGLPPAASEALDSYRTLVMG